MPPIFGFLSLRQNFAHSLKSAASRSFVRARRAETYSAGENISHSMGNARVDILGNLGEIALCAAEFQLVRAGDFRDGVGSVVERCASADARFEEVGKLVHVDVGKPVMEEQPLDRGGKAVAFRALIYHGNVDHNVAVCRLFDGVGKDSFCPKPAVFRRAFRQARRAERPAL